MVMSSAPCLVLRFFSIGLRLRGRHALFPPKGEEKKAKVESSRHAQLRVTGNRVRPEGLGGWKGMRRTGVLAVALALAAAPAEAATTRHASPAGSASHPTCDGAHPCTLPHAFDVAQADDEVLIRSGTYTLSTALDSHMGLRVRGVDGPLRPTIKGATAAYLIKLDNGGWVRHCGSSRPAEVPGCTWEPRWMPRTSWSRPTDRERCG